MNELEQVALIMLVVKQSTPPAYASVKWGFFYGTFLTVKYD